MLNIILGDIQCEGKSIFCENELSDSINIYGVYPSGIDILKAAQLAKPDVIVTDYILHDVDALELLKLFEEQHLKTKFIIYSAFCDDFVTRVALSLGVERVLKKTQDRNVLLSLLNSYAKGEIHLDIADKYGDGRLTVYISDILKKIGMRPNLLGFNYLLDLILLLISKDNTYPYFGRMSKLYEQLADKYNNRPNCIERNIRNCIETAWICGDIEYINSLFGFSIRPDKGKPTNSEFVGFICDYVNNTFDK